jgi:hypothetical protein
MIADRHKLDATAASFVNGQVISVSGGLTMAG